MKWYKVTFKQIQPIHIGSLNYGVLSETRIFIPGWTMWGAMTNANYRKSGIYNEKKFENITCFYPKIENEVFYPRFEDGDFYLGRCSEKEFRLEFTTTYLSTSINPQTLNAKDKSLHEIDVILPKELYWEGYIKCDEADLNQLDEIYIGGDSRYGLGLMKLVNMVEEKYPYDVKKGIYENNWPQNEPLSNFLRFNNQKFEGKISFEATKIDTSESNIKIKEADFYIIPGSIIK